MAPLIVGTLVLVAIALPIGIISRAGGAASPDLAFTSIATTVDALMGDEASELVIYRHGIATQIADPGRGVHFLGWSPDGRVAAYAATESCWSCPPPLVGLVAVDRNMLRTEAMGWNPKWTGSGIALIAKGSYGPAELTLSKGAWIYRQLPSNYRYLGRLSARPTVVDGWEIRTKDSRVEIRRPPERWRTVARCPKLCEDAALRP